MKKKHMIALAIAFIILLGVIIGIIVADSKKGNTDKEYDYTIHETDKNTVEEESENGLKESESEDGPILDEDNMVDFNGGDSDNGDKSDKTDELDDNKGDNIDAGKEDATEEPEVPETGAWGVFY